MAYTSNVGKIAQLAQKCLPGLRLNLIATQGACGTCPSSAGTMKMGIERALQVQAFVTSTNLFALALTLEELPNCVSHVKRRTYSIHLSIVLFGEMCGRDRSDLAAILRAGRIWGKAEGRAAGGFCLHGV